MGFLNVDLHDKGNVFLHSKQKQIYQFGKNFSKSDCMNGCNIFDNGNICRYVLTPPLFLMEGVCALNRFTIYQFYMRYNRVCWIFYSTKSDCNEDFMKGWWLLIIYLLNLLTFLMNMDGPLNCLFFFSCHWKLIVLTWRKHYHTYLGRYLLLKSKDEHAMSEVTNKSINLIRKKKR